MTCEDVCTQIWIDIPANSRITTDPNTTHPDVHFTITTDGDEFDLTFHPTALRQFLAKAKEAIGSACHPGTPTP